MLIYKRFEYLKSKNDFLMYLFMSKRGGGGVFAQMYVFRESFSLNEIISCQNEIVVR